MEPSYTRARLDEHRWGEPLLELGAGWDLEFHRTPFRERGASALFAQDVTAHEGAALDFVGDLCAGTDIPDELAGTVLLFNVLEHVYAPWLAAGEVYRVLQNDGLLLGSVPFRTAVHRHDRDYWRICPDGPAHLLRDYTTATPWKMRLLDLMRRRLGLSLEFWDGPWNTRRMGELGFHDWTVREYSLD